MKRLLPLLLCVCLLAACTPEPPSVSALEQAPTAEELALAVLEACEKNTDELERTDQLLDEASLSAYLTNYYGLEQGSWQDCAIYRAGGAEAFEIAVIGLAADADMETVLDGLNAYIQAREGDFTGYAPEQAALVHQSYAGGAEAALAGGSDTLENNALWARFAALFICEDPGEARSAFLRCLDPAAVPPAESPTLEDTAVPPSLSQQPEASLPATGSAAPEPAPGPSTSPPSSDSPSPVQPSPSVSVPEPTPSPEPTPPEAVTCPGREPYLQPGIDDMTVYDTGPILSAWESGDPSALSDDDRAVYDRCRQIWEEVITDDMSDYERERALYIWLTSNAVYDHDHYDTMRETDRHSYTPYGPLINGKGVCLGFASTFQLFMDLCDIECIIVVGAAFHSQEDHAWNMVRLSGQWYCADPTWDLDTYRLHYFNVTSDYMARTDHQWDYDNIPETAARDR